ncbi:hypothetical protein [Lysobacter capsici]|uniref:hypothetical protein n=1 Tax=Lysobacter capsici TaxID=435897 RepID=UPI001C006050|nr:hypothetical protein [Lysobacter capsici]QWF19131.1 hypothetical protein KME82_10525 [Lysobacter capsici]
MITDKRVAQEVSEKLLKASFLMNQSMLLVQEKCSEGELHVLREGLSKAMAELLLEVLNPLYQEHPDLAPEGLRVPPKASFQQRPNNT